MRTRKRSQNPSPLATLHEPRKFPDHHRVILRGMWVTTPDRTLFDLAATDHPRRVERALDTAWSKNLVSGRSLRRMLAELAKRGRTGITTMRLLLADRPDDWVPPASALESRFDHLRQRAGLPAMRRQVDLGGDHAWIGRVDFVNRELGLVVEVQSERFHASPTDRTFDAHRRRELEAAGFTVVFVWEHELWHQRDLVIRRLRQAHQTARWASGRREARSDV